MMMILNSETIYTEHVTAHSDGIVDGALFMSF